jgi:hypothetical protein
MVQREVIHSSSQATAEKVGKYLPHFQKDTGAT